MVMHSTFCKILWFYHGFCTPQNSSLPAVLAVQNVIEENLLENILIQGTYFDLSVKHS